MALNTLPNEGLTSRGYPSDRIVTPLIINGDMQIAQRGTSTASITGTDVFVVDRWRMDEGADSTLTMSQESLSSGNAYNNGFKKSLKVLVTTADSSIGSSQSVQLIQHVEAQNLQGLKFGTSGAKNLTLSFWYKSNVTGVHTVCIDKPDSTRTTCPLEFTVSSSGTWEKHVLNANANSAVQGSSGAIANDNGTGFRVMWGLAYVSSYLSGTSGTWEQNGTGSFSTSNQQNIVGSADNYVEVTGVQLEIGQFDSNTIPDFPFEDVENNLRRCRRYYEMIVNKDVNKVIATGGCYQSDVVSINYQWYPKRATPSVDQGSGTNYFGFNRGGGAITFNSIKIYSATATAGLLYSDDGVSASTYENGWIYIANSSAYVALDSEL